MAAMLVYLDKRILNIFFWKYTNMAANFFVVLIPRDWVKTLYTSRILNKTSNLQPLQYGCFSESKQHFCLDKSFIFGVTILLYYISVLW